jgi:RecA-family ATPase
VKQQSPLLNSQDQKQNVNELNFEMKGPISPNDYDENRDDRMSLFEAMKKGLVVESRGLR